MPLIDRFERRVTYLRVSVTDRCNFRCVYCMPAEGVAYQPREALLTFEELERVVRCFARHGVRRVRLTGGEPTLRRDLARLVAALTCIRGIDEVVMTSNAFLLGRHARGLAEAGLAGVNVSLDTLRPERFAAITRADHLPRVLMGIEAARDAGLAVKLNCVVVRGFNDDELLDLAAWAGARRLTLRFIEYMPIGGEETGWGLSSCVPAAELRAVLSARYQMTPQARGGDDRALGPARYWTARAPDATDAGQTIGFISAVTECFCEACNRVRLTAEGGLRVCLGRDGEVDLRALLREGCSDAALEGAIARALGHKQASHRFDLGRDGATLRGMSTIGG